MGLLNICPMNPDGDGLPILRKAGDAKSLTTSIASATTTLPTDCAFVRLVATANMCIKRSTGGGVAATNQDFMLAAGVPEYVPLQAFTYISAIEV